MRRVVFGSFVVALLPIVAPHARADAASQARKAAIKALKQHGKTFVKAFAQGIATERDTLLDAIDSFDAQVRALGYANFGGTNLAVPLATYLENVGAQTREFTNGLALPEDSIYDTAFSAGITNAEMPADFRFSTGGKCDEIVARCGAVIDKANAKIARRLGKLAKRLRKKEHEFFAFHIERPASPLAPLMLNMGWADASSVLRPPNIDGVLTFSDVTAPNDGEVYVLGSANPTLMNLPVTVMDVTAAMQTVPISPTAAGRWAFTTTSRPEGNVLCSVTASPVMFVCDAVVIGIE